LSDSKEKDNAQYWCTYDLKAGFHQIEVADASSYAVGAILSQMDKKQEQDFPVADASRTLNSTERNYSVFERELVAIVWALGHSYAYCYMASSVIFTDHKPLTSLKKSQNQGFDRMAFIFRKL
jgi:hypothetical protein